MNSGKPGLKRVGLKDVCLLIVDCVNKTAPVVESPTPYKMIRTSNVKRGWVNLSSVKFVTEEVFKKWTRRAEVRKGDVILTREAPLGEVGMIRQNDSLFLGQRLMQYRADPDKLDRKFLLYSFQADDMQAQIRATGSGATVEHMRVPDAENLTILIPSLSIQRLIGAILSAYDDLIENNNRRIQILEEMARRIYEEWFVRFRFPGHENVEMVGSELGASPTGWKVQSVTSLIAFDPRTVVPREGAKPFVPMSSLAENSMLISKIESREGNSGSKFKNGDTLFARITPCLENGKTGFVDFLQTDQAVAFGSTEYIVLRSKTVTPEFVYLTSRSEKFRQHAIKSMSGATGRQRVRVESFNEYLSVQPDSQTLNNFSEIISPIFKNVSCLARKNAVLRQTRNLLLPKLISGELDVSNFPEPMSD